MRTVNIIKLKRIFNHGTTPKYKFVKGGEFTGTQKEIEAWALKQPPTFDSGNTIIVSSEELKNSKIDEKDGIKGHFLTISPNIKKLKKIIGTNSLNEIEITRKAGLDWYKDEDERKRLLSNLDKKEHFKMSETGYKFSNI